MIYITPKTFRKGIEGEQIDRIEIFDGQTGKGFILDGKDEIAYVVENIKERPMKRDGISLGNMGYAFHISYVDDEGKVLCRFILNSENLIRKDPFFYTCEGGLCYEFLKEKISHFTSTSKIYWR